jgi:Zn-dependent peptidase ImmA (M78 family)
MDLRRGFKTEANDIAREIRRELGLSSSDPLDPRRLAEHLAIPIMPLTAMKGINPVVDYFTRLSTGEFSAVTLFHGMKRLIIYNDAHSPGRQVSDLAHELAHALLFHEPRPALDASGCRDWDEEQEREAEWLGPALLVSEEAALEIVGRGLSMDAATRIYGVSQMVIRMRLNVTGAYTRVQRAREYSSRSTRNRPRTAPRGPNRF